MQISLILGVILGIAGLKWTDGCSCQPTHPQEQYCHADYVIRAKIVGKELIYRERAPMTEGPSLDRKMNDPLSMGPAGQSRPGLVDFFPYTDLSIPNRPTKIIYSVYVEKIYKGDEFMIPKQLVKVTTLPEGSICGVTYLQENQKYILSGSLVDGELSTTICQYIKEYQQVTKRQKQGLKYHWKKECSNGCQMRMCFGLFCPYQSVSDLCTMDFTSQYQCEVNYARCSRNKHGQCDWYGKKDFRECQKSRSRGSAESLPFMP